MKVEPGATSRSDAMDPRVPPDQRGRSGLILTRDIGDRALLGIFCAVVTLFFILVCGFVGQWQATGLAERIWQHIVFEAFLAFGVFTALGVIWALFVPKWVERAFQTAYRKVTLAICLLAGTSACTALYFTFWR
jgi:hypothetical protein